MPLSLPEADSGGDVTVSLFAVVLLDSHEKGPFCFRAGGGGGADRFWAGACGGGDHGTLGRDPERPCNVEVIEDFGGNIEGRTPF